MSWPSELRKYWIVGRLLSALLVGLYGAMAVWQYVGSVGWPPPVLGHSIVLLAVTLSVGVYVLIDIGESWPKRVTFWVLDRRRFVDQLTPVLDGIDYAPVPGGDDVLIFRSVKPGRLRPVIACVFGPGQAAIIASREQWGLFVWRLPQALREPVLAAIPVWPIEHSERWKLGLVLAAFPLVELLISGGSGDWGIPRTLPARLAQVAMILLAGVMLAHWLIPRLRLRAGTGWRAHGPQIATFALFAVAFGLAWAALRLCSPCAMVQWSDAQPAVIVAPAAPDAPGSQLQFEQVRTGLGCGGVRWLTGLMRNTGNIPLMYISVNAQWPDGREGGSRQHVAWLRPGEYASVRVLDDQSGGSSVPGWNTAWTRASLAVAARVMSPEESAALEARPASHLRIADTSLSCRAAGLRLGCYLTGRLLSDGTPLDWGHMLNILRPILYDASGNVVCIEKYRIMNPQDAPGEDDRFAFQAVDCADPAVRFEIQIR